MRPTLGVVFAVFLVTGLAAAQTTSQATPSPADESDWLPHAKTLSAPVRAIQAPARAIGKWFKRSTTTPTPSNEPESTGVVAFEQLQANATPLGTVFVLNTDVGYAFSSHFTAEVGVPVFFVRSPFSLVNGKDWRWTTWLVGDPYLDLRYTTKFYGADVTSILTGTLPVSTTQRVFTTGRAGVDWFNHVEKSYKGVTPFLNLGAANGTVSRFVMPRPYAMARPYQSLGFMSDFEGGVSYKFRHNYAVGVSAYALVPGGTQKVYSRLVAPDYAYGGDGNHNRYFDSTFLTVGPSDIARDNGYSGWVELTHLHHMSVQIGYTRSIHYAFDAVTLMLNFDGGFLFKEPSD